MFKNGLYNGIGALLRFALAIITSPLFIRLTGPEKYGLWTLIWAGITLLNLGEAGFSVSSTVFISKDLANKDNRSLSQSLTIITTITTILATVVSALFWLSADFVFSFFSTLTVAQRSEAVTAFHLGAIMIWTRLMVMILTGVLQAFHKYGGINLLGVLSAIASNIFLLALAFFSGNLIILMLGQVLVAIVSFLGFAVLTWQVLRPFKVRPAWSRQRSIAIMRYSLLSWFSLVGNTLFNQGDRVIVGLLLNPTLLGIYGAVTSIGNQLNSISSMPVQPILPTISNLVAAEEIDYPLIQQKVRSAVLFNGIVALGLGASLFTAAPLVMGFLFPQATPSDNTLYISAFRLSVLIYTLYSTNAVGYFIAFGINAVKVNTYWSFIGGVFSLLLIGLGAKFFGLNGAVAGNIAYALTWIANYYAFKKLNIQLRLWFAWLGFPLLWFFVFSAFGYWFAQDLISSILLTFAQSIIFLIWLIINWRPQLSNLLERFKKI